jgi:hypothetical protein
MNKMIIITLKVVTRAMIVYQMEIDFAIFNQLIINICMKIIRN